MGEITHVNEQQCGLGGVVTLSAISLISAIEQQAKWWEFYASALTFVGEFRSIGFNVTTPTGRSRFNTTLHIYS